MFLLKLASGSTFVHVIVRNFSQKLDGITWIDVRFENCTIKYDGGPLTLFDVVFVGCSFAIGSKVPKVLSSTIAGEGPITVFSDYPA